MIQINNLSKWFGEKLAVDQISFEVQQGQVMGLLGPNGAGKSTTMKMMIGGLRPTSGSVLIGGYDVWKSPTKAKSLIGFLPESAPTYDDLTVSEFLSYLASLRGMRGKKRAKQIDRVIELCFLEGVRYQSADTLSKGYRHRLCLAQSLLHDPPYLIFDEPTDGLDPNQKREIQNVINEFRKEKAIILSTHILEEVSTVCTDVVLLNQGNIIRKKTPDALRQESAKARVLSVKIHEKDILDELLKLEGVRRCIEQDHFIYMLECQYEVDECAKREELAAKIINLCQQKKWRLTKIHFEEGSLEEVFRNLTFKIS